jgi:hypothetical protein
VDTKNNKESTSVSLLPVQNGTMSVALRFGRKVKAEELEELKDIIAKNLGDEKAQTLENDCTTVRVFSKSIIWSAIKSIITGELFGDIYRTVKASLRYYKEKTPLQMISWYKFASAEKAKKHYEKVHKQVEKYASQQGPGVKLHHPILHNDTEVIHVLSLPGQIKPTLN